MNIEKIEAIQTIIGGIKVDGVWGPASQAAFQKILAPDDPADQDGVIATINGPEGQTLIRKDSSGRVYFTSDADVDCDGSGGNPHHDLWYQPDTTTKGPDGKALNAETVPFIVIPLGIKGGYMGCKARITNIKNGKFCYAVVGDRGPRVKSGELSCEAARRMGLSGNPNTGGTDDKIILYECWPGVPATVDGITYSIQ